MTKETGLAKLDERSLTSPMDPEAWQQLMEDNYEGDTPGLVRVGFPTGGGKAYTVPGAAGDELADALEGVIVFHHRTRAFWKQRGDNNPPDCSSLDGIQGTEYGACATCRFNAWGSASGDDGGERRGKACKEMRRLYLLQDGAMLPLMVNLPPGSLSNFGEYRNRLTTDMISLKAVITRITLTQTKTPDGITYSVAELAAVGKIPEDQVAHVRQMARQIEQSANQVGITADDYKVAGDEEPPVAPPPAPPPALIEAEEFLRETLSQGELKASEVTAAATERPKTVTLQLEVADKPEMAYAANGIPLTKMAAHPPSLKAQRHILVAKETVAEAMNDECQPGGTVLAEGFWTKDKRTQAPLFAVVAFSYRPPEPAEDLDLPF